jgi:tol-pal system protein YbgF
MKLIKNGKTALGIYQDGLTIKAAQLSVINGKISLTELTETTLSYPLYPHEERPAEPETEFPVESGDVEPISDLADFTEDFKIPDLAELEEADYGSTEEAEPIMTGKQEFQKLISQFPLDTCRISMNALEEDISFTQFDETFSQSHSRSKIKKKLRDELLSKEEQKNKDNTFDFIRNKDNSILSFTETGSNDILHALKDINPLISKKRFFYSFIEPIEVSLMNLVRNNYDFSADEYVLLIYIGIDTKFGIVMKGNDFVKNFPLIVPDSDIEHMRQVIYSKIILEQDTSNVNITSNIILSGEMAKDDDVEFFRNRINSGAQISRISLEKLHIPQAKEETFPPERIADYCIPIALAWKTLEGRNRNFYPCNLLPSKIIENQKPFKIAWHGFIVLTAIFYVAFSATFKNLNIGKDIIEINRENSQVELELRKNRAIVIKLQQVKGDIEILQENLKKVDKLIGNKNQWYYMLNVISNSFNDHKISWLTSLNSQEKTFKVSGFTTRKRNVIPFSNLFPNGNVEKVTENTIQNVQIWQYDITFGYPDPIEVAKQKKEGEPGIEFIKNKEQLKSPQVQIENFTPPQEKQEEPVKKPQTFSSNDKTRYNQIIELYFSGHFQKAYDQFNEFLSDFPDSKYSHSASYLLGECLYQMDDIDQAILVFDKVVTQNGIKTPDALMMLGNAYAKNNNVEQAKFYWNRIIHEYPNNSLAPIANEKLNHYSQTETPREQTKKIPAKENQLETQYELQLYADGNYDAVLGEQKKLKLAGYNAKIIPVSTSKGIIYRLRIDDLLSGNEALDLGQKISTQQNAYHDFWITKVDAVQEPVDKSVEVPKMSNQEEIQNKYSTILDKYFANDLRGAYDDFYSFLKKYPNSELASHAEYFMGEAQYQMGNIPDAITIFSTVVEKNSVKTPDALMMLGNSYYQLEEKDKALYYWNELISRFPHNRLADIAQLKAIEIKD